MNLHPALQHLTASEVDELIADYNDPNQRIETILRRYEIELTPGRLARALPPKQTDDTCPYCEGISLVLPVASRSARQKPRSFCPNCGHGKRSPCRCSNCKRFSEKQLEIQTREVWQAVSNTWPKPDNVESPETLTLTAAVGALAIHRQSVDGALSRCRPFHKKPFPLAPTHSLTHELVLELRREGLLYPSHETEISAFILNSARDGFDRYFPEQVVWLFAPALSIDERLQYLRELEALARSSNWPNHWTEAEGHLWREIAIAECLENAEHLLAERHFSFNGDSRKLRDTIDQGLDTFSPFQMFNLLWQAAKETVDYVVREGIPNKQGKAVFGGILRRKIDTFVTKGWTPGNSRRNYDLPRSSAHSVFFDVFLEFEEEPNEASPPILDR